MGKGYCLDVITFLSIFCGYAAEKPPHLVFMVADDLGWNDVGWHNPDMITPNMNRLAMAGVRLNYSYVQPRCSPSRNCFMSGLYPYRTGLQHRVIQPDQAAGLPTNITILPQKLKELGYTTHIVGKWHLGFCNWNYTPTFRGFDSFLGFYSGYEDFYDHTHTNFYVEPKGAPFMDGYDFRFNTSIYHPPEGEYATHTFVKRAIDIISSLNPNNDQLFLYVPFQLVHGPFQVPKNFEDMYPNVQHAGRRKYCGMVSALDEAVGNITDALREKGFMDNLLMVFTSDNGGPTFENSNNLPLRGAKKTLWEGGTRGAAFVYSDTLLKKKGYENNRMMHAVDWMPTFVAAAGGQSDHSIDGKNMWPSISEDLPSPRTEFVYNIDEIFQNAAIRIGDYKLIEGSAGEYNDWYQVRTGTESEDASPGSSSLASEDTPQYQLYNIKDDPTEQHDISASEPYVMSIMVERLACLKRNVVPAQNPWSSANANPDLYNGTWSPGWC